MTHEERFWSRVDKGADCWTWTARKDQDGYGLFKMDGRRYQAHRVAYLFVVGEIPDGKILRHSCDRPDCVNPAHLTPGTQRENMEDRNARNRQARGERNGRAKLTADRVAELRANFTHKYGDFTRLSREFGINKGVVRDIVRRKTWRHVSPVTPSTTQSTR